MTPIAILMPVFNDWKACSLLLSRLDAALSAEQPAVVYIVDDGSTTVQEPIDSRYRHLQDVHVIRLRRNLGHQRAICIGLCALEDQGMADYVVVMDSDGEDAPSDVPRLLDHAREHPGRIAFAERTKRSESWWFRAGYVSYKWIHRLATGQGISFGNFSVIPKERLRSLVLVSDLWNNYAASILSSRQPYAAIPTVRARRLHGSPKMNLVRLIAHGLSAISVFGETLAVRLMLFSAGLVGIVLVLAAGVAIYYLSGGRQFPGTVLQLVGWAVLLAMQAGMFSVLFAFLLLNRRSEASFVPIRDYRLFIDEMFSVHPAALTYQNHLP